MIKRESVAASLAATPHARADTCKQPSSSCARRTNPAGASSTTKARRACKRNPFATLSPCRLQRDTRSAGAARLFPCACSPPPSLLNPSLLPERLARHRRDFPGWQGAKRPNPRKARSSCRETSDTRQHPNPETTTPVYQGLWGELLPQSPRPRLSTPLAVKDKSETPRAGPLAFLLDRHPLPHPHYFLI